MAGTKKNTKKSKIPEFKNRGDLGKWLRENGIDRRSPEAQAAYNKIRDDRANVSKP